MPRQPSGELPWTPAETKQLVSHAEVIAALRDKVEGGMATDDEKKQFAKAVFALKKSIEDKERPSQVILAKSADGHELRFDLNEIRKTAEAFYRGHGLEKLADQLPQNIRLSPQQIERIKEAAKEGFDRVFIFPSIEQLATSRQTLIEQCATQPSAALSGTEQYTAPYIDDTAKTPVIRNRPTQKAYLLLYSSQPIKEETKNLTHPQVTELFNQKKWNGLTLEEYLLLQRLEAESRGNHSFDAYSTNAVDSNSTRLMDSTSDAGASRVLDAGWYPGNRQVRVLSNSSGGASPNLGARPSVVLSLEPLP